jgi:O-acetyl-ADP-ribose deacetylase (regulator of RNase III)
VEAIVSSANCRLDRDCGVAKCIADAAGKKFEAECRQLIQKHKRLKTSYPVHTSAGNLPPPTKYVIHVAGPEAVNFKDKSLLWDAMVRTFDNVLKYANDELKVKSVAIPAISSGTVYYYFTEFFVRISLYRLEKPLLRNCTVNKIH